MNTVETTYASCTPHRPGARFHISYDDFDEIALDTYNSDALRAFQAATDQRIRWLRRTQGIPATHLPSADDLWIAMPYKAVEKLTLKRVGHSVCQRIFADTAVEDAPPSLIVLGFIRRRFVARRTSRVIKDVPTTVYIEKDDEGNDVEFIVVNEVGDYIGIDGKEYSAPLQGFGLIERQYLYCIEAIRAAIAALDYLEPPESAPRWEATIKRREPKGQKESAAAQRTANSRASDATMNEQNLDARWGTNPVKSGIAMSFAKENNIAIPDLSREFTDNSPKFLEPVRPLQEQAQQFMLYRDTIDSSAVRVATWCPETIIALSSCVLAIPVRPPDSDEEALQAWLTKWAEPAQRLCAMFGNVADPSYAWREINKVIAYMADPASPSWFQQGRTRNTPVTLLNVINNFAAQQKHQAQTRWYSDLIIAYDGPPLILEEDEEIAAPVLPAPGSVTGITEVSNDQSVQATESAEEPRSTGLDQESTMMDNEVQERCDEATNGDEEPRDDELPVASEEEPMTDKVAAVPKMRQRKPGMSWKAARRFIDDILDECPALLVGHREIDVGRFEVCIEYGPSNQWLVIDPASWQQPPPEIHRQICLALGYAESLEGDDPPPPEQEQRESEEHDAEQGRDSRDHQDTEAFWADPAAAPISEDGDELGAHRTGHSPGRLCATTNTG